MTSTTLERLGFDAWFRDRQPEPRQPDGSPARITAVDRDRYLVRDAEGEIPAEVSGAFRFGVETSLDLPCLGDWVSVDLHDGRRLAIVHAVFPRKSLLQRKTPGKRIDFQLVAANIDVAFLVQNPFADASTEHYRADEREIADEG